MTLPYDYQQHAILFVDDEQQALKYFEKLFHDDFRVLTASSAADAWKVLEQQGDEIGVVVADQRMPGTTGVSLLEQVKGAYPEIVRILTTAYSGLENAMAAVNQGGAFRYVTKPWNLEELRGDLLRAMEFFLVTRDRNRLLAEKLSVFQRVLVMDRARGLAALAAGLQGRLHDPMGAVKAFVAQASKYEAEAFPREELMRADLWTLARRESVALVRSIRAVLDSVGSPADKQAESLDVLRLVREVVERLAARCGEEGVTLQVHAEDHLSAIPGDGDLIARLVEILVQRIADMDGEERNIQVTLRGEKDTGDGEFIVVQLTSDGPAWSPQQLASLFSSAIPRDDFPMGIDMDLLSAFLIAHHHGGRVCIQGGPPAGPGFHITLSCDRARLVEEDVDADWFENIFRRIENQLEYPPV